MPVIRPTERATAGRDVRATLVDSLRRELMGERTPTGPFIYEMPTGQGDQLDVVVIWEAWRPLPSAERTAVIRDAYRASSEELSGAIHVIDPSRPAPVLIPPVAIAVGATRSEALAQGLLPYSVVLTVRPDGADTSVIRYMMRAAGALETPEGVELRFPDARLASEARDRLMRELPNARWEIVDDSGRFED